MYCTYAKFKSSDRTIVELLRANTLHFRLGALEYTVPRITRDSLVIPHQLAAHLVPSPPVFEPKEHVTPSGT
jgi:hypothetical protein